ncbi:hypothetical protein QQX98_008037 [Neonectria punicea]|uniref:Uncharacterized protein n=1 Tax=Neonectria punicea TaxID=979145 RepID=A0ABR1GWP7_9HYPO
MYWECDCLKASEVFPKGLPDPETTGTDPRTLIQLSGKQDLDKTWPKLIRMYSETDLTYEKDRLVAISGVVRILAARVPVGPYLAGIWRRRWIDGLLWEAGPVFGNVMDNHHGSGNGCPSWSWASSLKRPINESGNVNAIACPGTDLVEFDDFEHCPDRPLARLSDSKIDLSGDDEYGSVNLARIDLTGLVIPVWLPPLDQLQEDDDHFMLSTDTTVKFVVVHGKMKFDVAGQSELETTSIEFSAYIHGVQTQKTFAFVTAQYERELEDETAHPCACTKSHRYQSHRAHVNLTSTYDPKRQCFLLPLLDAREIMDDDGLD